MATDVLPFKENRQPLPTHSSLFYPPSNSRRRRCRRPCRMDRQYSRTLMMVLSTVTSRINNNNNRTTNKGQPRWKIKKKNNLELTWIISIEFLPSTIWNCSPSLISNGSTWRLMWWLSRSRSVSVSHLSHEERKYQLLSSKKWNQILKKWQDKGKRSRERNGDKEEEKEEGETTKRKESGNSIYSQDMLPSSLSSLSYV